MRDVYYSYITKPRRKGGAYGAIRIAILITELFFIWALTAFLGLASAVDPPVWALSLLIIGTDRAITKITDFAEGWRTRYGR